MSLEYTTLDRATEMQLKITQEIDKIFNDTITAIKCDLKAISNPDYINDVLIIGIKNAVKNAKPGNGYKFSIQGKQHSKEKFIEQINKLFLTYVPNAKENRYPFQTTPENTTLYNPFINSMILKISDESKKVGLDSKGYQLNICRHLSQDFFSGILSIWDDYYTFLILNSLEFKHLKELQQSQFYESASVEIGLDDCSWIQFVATAK